MLYILNGPDRFRADEALREIREALAVDAHGTSRFDVKEDPIGEILAACRTAGFFAESRLVIVTGLLGRFGGARGRPGRRGRGSETAASRGSELDPVVEALTNLPPATTVVLLDDVAATNALLQALTPVAELRSFAFLRRAADIRSWAEARVRTLGAPIAPAALNRLLQLIDGEHLGELAQELDKLALYCDGRRIEVADVDALVSAAQAFKTWDLTDAVVEGRTEAALRAAQELLSDRQPATLQIYMLTRLYRQLLLLQTHRADGLSASAAAARVGVTAPFIADKLNRQAARYGVSDLEAAYAKLLAADAAIKRGQLDDETALFTLIADLAALGRTGRAAPASARR